MKRRIILFLVLTILVVRGQGQAQNTTVTIPDITASPGKEVYLDIQVTNLTGLQVFSADFSLAFDANLLQALEVISAGTISAAW